MSNCWGVSFHIDCRRCDANIINDKEKLKMWVKKLVKDINMVAYGQPQIVWFGEAGSNKEGFTVVQLIETSNIIAHCNSSDASMYLDIFTCKIIDNLEEKIEQNIFEWFKPAHITISKLNRQA